MVNGLLGEGDDFDGDGGAVAELADALAVIADDDEALGGGGDDFFAQECATESFDEVEVWVYFVGSIYCYVNLLMFIEGGEGDTNFLGLLGSCLGGGDGEDVVETAVCQHLTNSAGGVNGRAARPQTDNHARAYKFNRFMGGLLLEFLYPHVFAPIISTMPR